MNLKVGSLVRLKVPCMGNPPGNIGVCYETYCLGEPGGASLIFINGEYCGFSAREQEEFFEFVGHDPMQEHYRFTNVMNLCHDYENGRFKFNEDISIGSSDPHGVGN